VIASRSAAAREKRRARWQAEEACDFDPPVAAVSAQQGSSAPGPVVQGGGPTGQFLRLVNNNVNSQSNHYAYDLTDPGAFSTITADFDIRTSGGPNPADGMAFMLLPTSAYGAAGVGPGGYFGAEEPNFPGIFAVGVDLYPAGGGVNDVSAHWNGREVRNGRLNPAQVDLDSGAFHRIHTEVQQIGPGSNILLQATNDVNGAASPTVTAVQQYVYGLLPYEDRVQLSARTGGANMDVDLDNINVQYSNPYVPPPTVSLPPGKVMQDFDSLGTTPFITTQYGTTPGPLVVPGGPTGNFIRLANDNVANQRGAIGFDRGGLVGPSPGGLRMQFDFRMGGGGDGADGFGVAFLNTANYGTSGAAPNFSEEPNLTNSFGLGIDIHDNGAGDVSQDSISFHWNGAKVGEADLTGRMDLENGVFNRAQVLLAPTTDGAVATVVITPNVHGPTPGAPVSATVEIPGFNPYEGRLAFTARTGGLNADHDLDNIEAESVDLTTLGVMGHSSGGSVWHFTSDPGFVDDPSGLVGSVSLPGGAPASAQLAVPRSLTADPFYVVVEATDQGSPPAFAGTLMAPYGYVFDANQDGDQDPGEAQFFTTQGLGPDNVVGWAGSAGLVPPSNFQFPADEVGAAGLPFPAGTERVWYGPVSGTAYFSAQVPPVIQGEWVPPTPLEVTGTPEPSVSAEPGLTARVLRTDGVALRDIDTAMSAMNIFTPDGPGHYATSESVLSRLDLGDTAGSFPGYEAILSPHHNDVEGDGEDTAARFTGYLYIPSDNYVRTFAVASDDGYRLKIGETVVLEYPDDRGMPASPEVVTVSFPQAGYWPIEVDYYNGTSASGLEVSSRAGGWWPLEWNPTDFKILGDPSDDLVVLQRPIPSATVGGDGLLGWYHDRSGDDFGPLRGWRNDLTTGTGSPAETEFNFPDNFAYGPWGNLEDNFKVRWVGTINIPTDGNYNFRMDTDDRSAIFIDVDGDGVVDPAPGGNWAWTVTWNNVPLSAGPHKVEFWALEYGGGEWSRLQWQKPGDPGLSNVPADVFTWEVTTGVGANSAGSPLLSGAIAGAETAGDGALVQAVGEARLPGNNAVDNTAEAIQYFQLDPDAGTIQARSRVNITDTSGTGTFGGDDRYPGLEAPGPHGGNGWDNVAFRTRALFYSPGNETYSFAVASDDGFRIDINGRTFGWLNGGRGQSGTNSNYLYVYFPEPGFYKFDLHHYEGGGGAGIELSHKTIGTQSDLNLLVASPDPEVEGYSIDLANRFYTFSTHARLSRYSTDLNGAAFAYVPALGLSIPPDHWALQAQAPPGGGPPQPGLLAEYYDFSATYAWDAAHKVGERAVLTSGDFNFGDNYAYGPWGNLENNFGVRYTGFLDVPVSGTYSFHMDSDDVSWIFIDIDGDGALEAAPGNDNWHVYWDVDLAAGLHAVEFRSREFGGGESSRLSWIMPGDTAWQYIPAQYFVQNAYDGAWLAMMYGSGQIGDMLDDALIQRFPYDPDTEYTLRLITSFFGQTAIAELTTVFVPEPTTCLLLAGGLLLLVRRRRRN